MDKIIEIINTAKNIAIFTHINPDPDALGSAFGFCFAMKSLGKNCCIFFEKDLSDKFEFLDRSLYKTNMMGEFDLAVSLDTSDSKRLGVFEEYFLSHKNTLALDHHKTHIKFSKQACVDFKMASCCELLFVLFKNMNLKLNKEIATCLYLGVSGDTGCFIHDNTTAFTHECAKYLFEAGADFSLINTKVFMNKKFEELKLMQKFISSIEIVKNIAIGQVLIKDKLCYKDSDLDTSSFINAIRYIDGVEIAVLIKQVMRGQYKVSLRSSKKYDVSIIAEKFNGGGHKQAAGFIINKNLKKLKKEILNEVLNLGVDNEN